MPLCFVDDGPLATKEVHPAGCNNIACVACVCSRGATDLSRPGRGHTRPSTLRSIIVSIIREPSSPVRAGVFILYCAGQQKKDAMHQHVIRCMTVHFDIDQQQRRAVSMGAFPLLCYMCSTKNKNYETRRGGARHAGIKHGGRASYAPTPFFPGSARGHPLHLGAQRNVT